MADALQREQTRTLKASQAFRSIIEGTSASTGEEFFRSLVRSLASTLGAKFTHVGELTGDLQSVRTLAICIDGQIADNVVYALRDTPCEGVVTQSVCYYTSKVQEQFPRDEMLRKLEIHSYLGAPLVDSGGKPIGLLVVPHQRSMYDDFRQADSTHQ